MVRVVNPTFVSVIHTFWVVQQGGNWHVHLPSQSTSCLKVESEYLELQRYEELLGQVRNPMGPPLPVDIEDRSCFKMQKLLNLKTMYILVIHGNNIKVNKFLWRQITTTCLCWVTIWFASLLMRSVVAPSFGFLDISSPLRCLRISTVQQPILTWYANCDRFDMLSKCSNDFPYLLFQVPKLCSIRLKNYKYQFKRNKFVLMGGKKVSTTVTII